MACGDTASTDCAVLQATAAELTSGPIQTSRGPATAPIWVFTLTGTAVKVTRVAIANPIEVAPNDGGWALGLTGCRSSCSRAGR